MASMAEDASALLEALDIPRAHAMGWSLGSAVAQELALAHPEQVATAIMYATWARCDGFQRSVLTALRHPYATGTWRRRWPPPASPSPRSCSTTPTSRDAGADAPGVPAERRADAGHRRAVGRRPGARHRWTGSAASPPPPW